MNSVTAFFEWQNFNAGISRKRVIQHCKRLYKAGNASFAMLFRFGTETQSRCLIKTFFTEQVLRMVSGNGNSLIIISEYSQRIITEMLQVQHQQGLGQMNLECGY